MPTQDAFKLSVALSKFGSLHDVLVHCVRTNGPPKDEIIVKQLGAQKGHFSEVINEKGKHWPETWIKYIAANYDPDNLIARYVAKWQGLTVRPARRISDAAHRRASDRYFAGLGAAGAAMRAEIEALAMAEPETDEDGQ